MSTTTTTAAVMNATTAAPLVIDSIHGGLWAVMAVIFVALVVLWTFAVRKGWFRWAEHYSFRALATSSFANDDPAAQLPNSILLFTRVVSFIFSLIIYIALYPRDEENDDWQYYTIWNFFLVVLLFFGASIYSVAGRIKQWQIPTTGAPNIVGKAVVILYSVCLPMAILVDVLYWVLLYPDYSEDNPDCCTGFINITIHGLNLLLLLVELVQNRIVLLPAHVLACLTWAFCYGIFQWIIGSTGYMLAYFFLDTEDPISSAWYFGIFVMHAAFYFLSMFLSFIKEKCLMKQAKVSSDTDAEQEM